ncbi:hypothetical protein BC629DRAFT_1220067 [Irpex lacteus]|nr:hypothetical protein BC629DRAFT_1220067 [Irpex lacteus]
MVFWASVGCRLSNSHVPWWVRIWIKRFPLVFLVLAVGCFFVALILFAFIPRQNRETFVVTVILSSASCFGLVVVSLWFSFELIVYTVFGGRKWLSVVFADIHVVSFVARHWELLRSRRNGQTVNDTERACSDDHTLDPGSGLQETAKYCADLIRSGDVPPKFIFKTRSLWQTLLHRILQTRSDSDEHQPAEQPSPWDMLHRVASEIGDTKPQRMSEAILQFKSKGEAIRCLHFFPNGSMLAISCVHKSGNSGRSSASSTVFLSSIRHDQQHEPYALEHPDPNSYIRQIHWAPDGRKFFTRSHYMLGVWQMEGNNWNTPTLVRELPSATVEHRMRSASWRFDGDTGNIIYVEGRRTIIENTSRHLALANCIQYLQFRHLCVKQGTCWMVGAGTYALEDQGLPRRHYIILWKLQSSGKVEYEIIKKIPVVRAISKMMLAESSQKSILVSFENKASSQLWEIEGDDTSAYIAFRHQYDPECDIQCFSDLYSIFGGTADSLVLRATSAGDIHVWHRETAEPMRCIKRPSLVKGEITCLAWNRGSGKYMLATGTKDGAVYIWTEPEKKPSSDESQTAKSAAAGAAFLKPVRGGQNDSKTDTESNNENVELKETSITVSPAVTPGIEDT